MDARESARQIVLGLLEQHGLEAPAETFEMLVSTRLKSRIAASKSALRKKELPVRQRLKRANTYARKLLKYMESPPTRQASIATHYCKLLDALNAVEVVPWFVPIRDTNGVLITPRLDLTRLLDNLRDQKVSKKEMAKLLEKLERLLSNQGKRTGRPPARGWYIVRAGYIAWRRSGRQELFTWDESTETLKGPLPAFLRDLLRCCEQEPISDKHLQKRLVDCEADKNVQAWLQRKNERLT